MRPSDIEIRQHITTQIESARNEFELPGIANPNNEACFVEQMIDSYRRIKYVFVIRDRINDQDCTNAEKISFDPLRAAAFFRNIGDIDEACWLTFLSTHFGKNLKTKWNLLRGFYSGINSNEPWKWLRIKENINEFLEWLNENQELLKGFGNFGNHRKYITLSAKYHAGTGAAIQSYIEWIQNYGSHSDLFNTHLDLNNGNRFEAFESLYLEMNNVKSFARMGKFDFLTMIGKMGLAEIEPGHPYMSGATGPISGAKLMFGGQIGQRRLSELTTAFGQYFNLPFKMQIIEDAICNWQKSPGIYRYFGG